MVSRITVHEARQRCAINRMTIRNTGFGDFRVSFNELEAKGRSHSEPSAYYTDDLEDAVLTASAMRRRKDGIAA